MLLMKTKNFSQNISEIIEKYETSQGINISMAYEDGGVQNPCPRLHRAAENKRKGTELIVRDKNSFVTFLPMSNPLASGGLFREL